MGKAREVEELELVLYSPISLRYGGGFENSLLTMMPHLRASGVRCSLFCTDFLAGEGQRLTDEEVLERLESAGSTYAELEQITIRNVPVPRPAALAALVKAVSKADAAYLNNAYGLQDILGLVLSRFDTPIISGYHAPFFSDDPTHNRYVKYVTLPLAKHFHASHVLNSDDARVLRRWGVKEIYTISPGVDTQRFVPRTVCDDGTFKVLFVGRLVEQKGISLLIEVIRLASLRGYEEKMRFAIAGSGPLANILHQAVSRFRNVHVLGYVDPSRLPSLYSEFDILIMPSLRETFGNVALEALASGLPVLAFSIPGPRDFIRDGVDGILLSSLNADALFGGLERAFAIWRDRKEQFMLMGKAARQNAIRFDCAQIGETFAKMVKEVSGRH